MVHYFSLFHNYCSFSTCLIRGFINFASNCNFLFDSAKI